MNKLEALAKRLEKAGNDLNVYRDGSLYLNGAAALRECAEVLRECVGVMACEGFDDEVKRIQALIRE